MGVLLRIVICNHVWTHNAEYKKMENKNKKKLDALVISRRVSAHFFKISTNFEGIRLQKITVFLYCYSYFIHEKFYLTDPAGNAIKTFIQKEPSSL